MHGTLRHQLAGAFARLDILRLVTEVLFDLEGLEPLSAAAAAAESAPEEASSPPLSDDEKKRRQDIRNGVESTNKLLHLLGYLLRRLIDPSELTPLQRRGDRVAARLTVDQNQKIFEAGDLNELFKQVGNAQGLAKAFDPDKTGRAFDPDKTGRAFDPDKTGRALSAEEMADLASRLVYVSEQQRLVARIVEQVASAPLPGESSEPLPT